jgi:hypothetical protein
MMSIRTTQPEAARTGRLRGECEVCEETRMVRTETFRHGGVSRQVRVCRDCAVGGREIETQEVAMTTKQPAIPGYRFAGNEHGLHTQVSIVVRNIEIEETPAGRMVKVTATMGESEANPDVVHFRLTQREAIACDILERVCRHCGGTDIRIVSIPDANYTAGRCFDCHQEWRG